ncbi:MAG: hypothetical protein ACXVEI_02340 [Actinomycetota bacterium]
MAKYLLLYGGGSMPETEAEQAAVMEAWTAWFTELGPAVVDAGNPFNTDSKTISSGPTITDAKATASGYSVIQADSLDQAAKYAETCPVLLGGAQVMVFETFEVM